MDHFLNKLKVHCRYMILFLLFFFVLSHKWHFDFHYIISKPIGTYIIHNYRDMEISLIWWKNYIFCQQQRNHQNECEVFSKFKNTQKCTN